MYKSLCLPGVPIKMLQVSGGIGQPNEKITQEKLQLRD